MFLGLTLLKPEKIFYILVFFLGVENIFFLYHSFSQPVSDEKIYFYYIMILFLFLGLMIKKSSRLLPEYPGTRIDPLIFVFFLWATLSLIWSQNRVHSAFEYFRFLDALILFFLMVSFIDSEKKIFRLAWALTITATVIAIMAALSFYADDWLHQTRLYNNIYFQAGFTHFNKRAGGLMGHNIEAFYMNICLPFSFEIFRRLKGKVRKMLFLIIPFTIMIGVFLTRSRSATVGLLIGFNVYMYLNFPLKIHLKKNFIKYTLFATVCVILILILSDIQNVSDEMERYVKPFYKTHSRLPSYARGLIWSAGFERFFHSMGFGVGCGGFKGIRSYPPHGHSLYFTPLFELGVIGFLIWIPLLTRIGHSVIDSFKKRADSIYLGFLRAATVALITCAFHGIFDFHYDNMRLWLIIGIAMSIVNLIDKEPQYPAAH